MQKNYITYCINSLVNSIFLCIVHIDLWFECLFVSGMVPMWQRNQRNPNEDKNTTEEFEKINQKNGK